MDTDTVNKLEQKLSDLKTRWPPPCHFVPVSMWQELEDLEEQIKNAKAKKDK
jgi:hypothetical protein